jgi:hypothetical protein
MRVIAVSIALIGDLPELARSLRLVPQRLQKLRPGATGLPQPEQYIVFNPFILSPETI